MAGGFTAILMLRARREPSSRSRAVSVPDMSSRPSRRLSTAHAALLDQVTVPAGPAMMTGSPRESSAATAISLLSETGSICEFRTNSSDARRLTAAALNVRANGISPNSTRKEPPRSLTPQVYFALTICQSILRCRVRRKPKIVENDDRRPRVICFERLVRVPRR